MSLTLLDEEKCDWKDESEVKAARWTLDAVRRVNPSYMLRRGDDGGFLSGRVELGSRSDIAFDESEWPRLRNDRSRSDSFGDNGGSEGSVVQGKMRSSSMSCQTKSLVVSMNVDDNGI